MTKSSLHSFYEASASKEERAFDSVVPNTSSNFSNLESVVSDPKLDDDISDAHIDSVDSAPEVLLDDLLTTIGQYVKLCSQPHQGSLLHFANKAGVRKTDVERYVTSRWGPNLGMNLFDDQVDPYTYFIYSLVVPHNTALSVAEHVQSITQKNNVQPFDLLAKLTGFRIDSRSDILNIVRTVARRSPKLLDIVMKMFK